MTEPRIVYIIQARMHSERLPGKVLMQIPGVDGCMLHWIVKQLRSAVHRGQIVVATSRNPENEAIAEWCAEQEIDYFRGDESHVLSRFWEVVKTVRADVVVRLTADNPLIDTNVLADTIERHKEHGNDYTATRGLPLGMNIEVVSASALLDLQDKNLSEADREHVTHYLRNNDGYRCEFVQHDNTDFWESIRLTVDYPADMLVASVVLGQYRMPDRTGLELVKYISEHHGWVFESNQSLHQKRQFDKVTDELTHAEALLRATDLHRAAELIKVHMQGGDRT